MIVLLDEWKVHTMSVSGSHIAKKVWKVTQREIGDLESLSRSTRLVSRPPTIRAVILILQQTIRTFIGRRFCLTRSNRRQNDSLRQLIVRAALPGVKQGAIIEQVIETADKSRSSLPERCKPFQRPFFRRRLTFRLKSIHQANWPRVRLREFRNESRMVRTEQGSESYISGNSDPPSFVFDELESYVR